MKEKIIELMKENHDRLYLPRIIELIPEAEGDYGMKMGSKGRNKNVYFIIGASEEFCKAVGELFDEEIIAWQPLSKMEVLFMGGPLYKNIPICTYSLASRGKRECLLYVDLIKGKNYPTK